jgi:hypothetical protein
MVNRLLYLAHTSPSVREQALYSALSALAHRGDAPLAIHVYTDAPEGFARLEDRVQLRTLCAGEIEAWTRPAGYGHRAKPAAIRDLAGCHPEDKLLFVDADTVFTGPVSAVFDRIAPRAAVMHEREYDVATSDLAIMHRFRRHLAGATFRGAPIDLRCDMWNSGAVGLHPHEFPIVDDWLAYLDEVFPRVRRWVLEQYAVGSLLQARAIRISEAADVLVHYWFDKDGYASAIRAALDAMGGHSLAATLAHVRENPIARPRRTSSYGKPANFFQRVFGW